MGRQIPIAMAAEDEAEMLSFLRSTGDIRFAGSFAPRKEDLWPDELPPAGTGHYFYSIWNTHFPWRPEYGQTEQSADGSGVRSWYVSNSSSAPVLDWSRCDLERPMFGRLYWNKQANVDYDVEEFEVWVNSIWRWIRKHGKKLEPGDSYSPYGFPGARRVLQQNGLL